MSLSRRAIKLLITPLFRFNRLCSQGKGHPVVAHVDSLPTHAEKRRALLKLGHYNLDEERFDAMLKKWEAVRHWFLPKKNLEAIHWMELCQKGPENSMMD